MVRLQEIFIGLMLGGANGFGPGLPNLGPIFKSKESNLNKLAPGLETKTEQESESPTPPSIPNPLTFLSKVAEDRIEFTKSLAGKAGSFVNNGAKSAFSGIRLPPLPVDLNARDSADERKYLLLETVINKVLKRNFVRKLALAEGQADLELPVNPRLFNALGVSIRPPPLHRVTLLKKYAAAAYCKREALVGWECGENCDTRTEGTHFEAYLTNDTEKTAGYVAVNHREKLVILSFRGSSNLNNWFDNAQMALVPFDLVSVNRAADYAPLFVHRGFQIMTRSLLDQTRTVILPLLSKYRNYYVAVTGHSAGGAVAVLAATALGANGLVPFNRIMLVTFGQPRVAGAPFSSYLNSQPIISARVTNGVDPINILPTQEMGFHHQHNELFLTRTNKTDRAKLCNRSSMSEDPTCARFSLIEKKVRGHYEYFGNFNTACT